MKTAKEEVIDFVAAQPDDVSLDSIVEGLRIHLSINEAIGELDRREGIPHEEVMESLDRWVESLGRSEHAGTSTESKPTSQQTPRIRPQIS